ncbi:3-oxoacyl-[acyl-carrier protein] reductase [Dyadobacter sp. SG02]|uniref:SDR family oxidoreductase n=1 Tax=Dyadobacter sp. SG02 TaxID=1855291 RepID=UPI0008AD38E1|nr:SDR family oxidoreductase [Dyadobacter sp. SG02]SEI50487.1 3-oxoacyl-[acyl-carrier protein] reductase [Dyadobacter sp. SG02]
MVEKRVAIVTGASSGIGAVTASRLAADFEGIVLVARRADELQKTAEQVRAAGAEPFIVLADLLEADAAQRIILETVDRFGRIDALINIAGAVPQVNIFEMSDVQWLAAMEVKFHSARRLTMQAWPHLVSSRGSIIFMSGTAAENPKPAAAAIGAINAAIDALSKAFAEQGIADGVQVNTVLPGPIMTGRRQAFLEKIASSGEVTMDQAAQSFLRESRIHRFGQPEEVAELIAFLVSPRARFITGTAIRIDGGEIKGI